MKAGKREDRLFFIIGVCLPFASLKRLVLWEQRHEPYGLTKRDSIKEEVQ